MVFCSRIFLPRNGKWRHVETRQFLLGDTRCGEIAWSRGSRLDSTCRRSLTKSSTWVLSKRDVRLGFSWKLLCVDIGYRKRRDGLFQLPGCQIFQKKVAWSSDGISKRDDGIDRFQLFQKRMRKPQGARAWKMLWNSRLGWGGPSRSVFRVGSGLRRKGRRSSR